MHGFFDCHTGIEAEDVAVIEDGVGEIDKGIGDEDFGSGNRQGVADAGEIATDFGFEEVVTGDVGMPRGIVTFRVAPAAKVGNTLFFILTMVASPSPPLGETKRISS